MKQNDWIIANINNPTFDAGDFLSVADMNLDNTQMLSKEEYLKSNFIRENEMFKDKSGKFSEDKFTDFYNQAASKFKEFSENDDIDNYEYDMFDITRPAKGKVKDPNFQLSILPNPSHMEIGIEGVNKISEPTQSARELALDSKIYDTASGKFLDKTVNDISLFSHPIDYFKSLFEDPLVYATYDQDTEEIDPYTGNVIKHRKGEFKVNDEGEYYVETLNGRSLLGKQVVSAGDYLTSEHSSLNQYDFFDSDDMQKSVTGTIMKTAAAIVPMLIPYVGTVYSSLLVARELSKSVPMLYGMTASLFGSESDSKLANTIAAYGEKFTGGTSDYSQLNMYSFENFGNLIADVATQWGQQKVLVNGYMKLAGGGKEVIEKAYAKAANKYLNESQKYLYDSLKGEKSLTKTFAEIGTNDILTGIATMIKEGKWAETPLGKAAIGKYVPEAEKIVQNRARIGLNLSLAYMSIISNTDVYNTVLEKGGTKGEAAAIALGSMMGMYAVDRYAHLGEVFFDPDEAGLALRKAATHNAELLMDKVGIQQLKSTTKKGIIGLIKKGIDSGKKTADEFTSGLKEHTLGFFGKALGEGIEEVSEELVADASKSIGELAGKFGYFSQTDYGAWENAGDRYIMSFLGGFAGGGIFYGVDAVQKSRENNGRELQSDLIYLIRQGKKDEILQELSNLKKKGKLGSRTLSYKTTDSSDGKVYLTADENNESQEDFIYKTLVKNINQLDAILNENGLKLSDDDLFDKMVQGEYRALALTDFLKGDNIESVKELSYVTQYQDDFDKIVNEINSVLQQIDNLVGTTEDTKKRAEDGKFKEELAKLEAKKADLIKQKDYLFGEGSLGYVEKMLFAMDPMLSGSFMSINKNQFVRNLSGKSLAELTPAEMADYTTKYDEYKKTVKYSLDEAFSAFKNIQQLVNPEIQKLTESGLRDSIKQMNDISEALAKIPNITVDDKLDDESDDDFKFRNTKKAGETEEDFNKRKSERAEKVKQINFEKQYKWVTDMAKLPLDRSTFRKLQAQIGVLKKNIKEEIVHSLKIPKNNVLEKKVHDILDGIDINEENFVKINDEIYKVLHEYYEQEYKNEFEVVNNQANWSLVQDNLKVISKKTPEERALAGIPEMYIFNDGDNVTYRDMYYLLKDFAHNNGMDIVVDGKINDDIMFIFPSEYNMPIDDSESGKLNLKFFGFVLEVESGMTDIDGEKGDIVMKISDKNILDMINNDAVTQTQAYMDIIEKQIYKALKDDIRFNALDELEKTKFIDNPIIPILKQIHIKFRNSNTNIESILQDIYESYKNGENADSFILESDQIEALNQFKQDLEIAKAFIYAASVDTNNKQPVGHNKQLNQFIKNHKDIFKGVENLPEIDQDIAAFLIQLANSYISEINAWINRSEINSANRKRRFIEADKALIKSKLLFFSVNRDGFKLEDGTDLLEGYEDLTLNDSLKSVVQVEELLHENYKKAIANGKTTTEIIEELIPKVTKVEELYRQKTAKLDEHLSYDKLTDYDKFQLIINNFALSSVDFYTNLKLFIEEHGDLAPLSVQEYAGRMAQAVNYDNNIINEALDFIAKKSGFPVLYNTTIITGVGGSGKTKAASAIAIGDGKDSWLCGPTDSQIKGLLSTLPKGEEKSKTDLFTTIFGGDKEATEFLNSTSSGKGYEKFFTNKGNGIIALNDSLKINKIKNPPKYIVIDEATHFNTAELLVISKFCKENNIKLILLGDTIQNGTIVRGLIGNIDRNFVIGWRTPRLSISLRDSNTQKVKNLKPIIDIVESFSDLDSIDETINAYKKIVKDILPNLTLNYYNGDNFTGELITDDIPNDIIEKIDGDIGFIGSESSVYYKKLVDAGKNPVLVDPLQVQGREFKYVIIDTDWELKLDSKDDDDNVSELNSFLKNLYTMISRSKEGTIIIDNGLSKIIKNKLEQYSLPINEIKESVEEFRKMRLLQINEALEGFELRNPLNQLGTNQDGTNGPIIPPNTPPSSTPPSSTPPTNTPPSTNPPTSNPPSTPPTGKPSGTPPSTTPPKSTPPKKKGKTTGKKIKGTEITLDDIENEEIPVDSKDEERKGEKDQAEKDQEVLFQSDITPFRAYGNVSIAGIDTSTDTWTNPDDSLQDLGIFVRKGLEITDPKQKDELVTQLMLMKSLFFYGISYYDRLPLTGVREIFDEKSFNEAEYYIRVEDVNDSKNRLIGLTEFKGLKNKDRGINGKVITLVAKLKGKDGKTQYEFTLGALANPNTWEKNVPSIKAKLNDRISHADPESERLKEYVKNLDTFVRVYKLKIENISKKNLEFRINKPNMSGMTDLVDLGRYVRLDALHPEGDNYKLYSAYSVRSKVYAVVDEIPGVSSSVKGKAVIYVTNNIFLHPNELERLYVEQKNNPNDTIPQVRMIVLDNLGVSFKSLYNSNDKSLITTTDGNTTFAMPFKLEPTAVRMYKAAWNFRSNLKRFLEMYKTFKEKEGLSDKEIEELCKLDTKSFFAAKGDKKYLDEKAYRDSITDPELRNKLLKIWDFNDSLSNYVREFRLGYSSENGAYLRKITNLTKDGFYKNPNNVVGIYINPSLAILYDNMLDKLFENVLNKIIPTELNPLLYIDENTEEDWFSAINKTQELSFNVTDENNQPTSMKISIPGESSLSSLPMIFTKIAKYAYIRGFNPETFDKMMEEGINRKYYITQGDTYLDWLSIVQELDGGQVQTDLEAEFKPTIPGIRPYSGDKKTGKKGIYDQRIDNLFSLMFHGLISLEEDNDFKGDDIRATDAPFKFGFFVDPLLLRKESSENKNAIVITNEKLFSTNVAPGFPIISFSFDPYTETKVETKVETKTEVSQLILDTRIKVKTDLASAGIKVSDKELSKLTTMEDLLNLAKTKIKNNFELYFKNNRTTPLENLYSNVELEGGNFKYTKFIDTIPIDKGDSVESYKHTNGVFKITTKNGRNFNFQIVEGKPTFTEVIAPTTNLSLDMLTVSDIRTNIDPIIKPLYDEMGVITKELYDGYSNEDLISIAEDEGLTEELLNEGKELSNENILDKLIELQKEIITEEYNKLFDPTKPEDILAKNSFKEQINKLLKKLQELFGEDNEVFSKVNKELTNLKDNGCPISL